MRHYAGALTERVVDVSTSEQPNEARGESFQGLPHEERDDPEHLKSVATVRRSIDLSAQSKAPVRSCVCPNELALDDDLRTKLIRKTGREPLSTSGLIQAIGPTDSGEPIEELSPAARTFVHAVLIAGIVFVSSAVALIGFNVAVTLALISATVVAVAAGAVFSRLSRIIRSKRSASRTESAVEFNDAERAAIRSATQWQLSGPWCREDGLAHVAEELQRRLTASTTAVDRG